MPEPTAAELQEFLDHVVRSNLSERTKIMIDVARDLCGERDENGVPENPEYTRGQIELIANTLGPIPGLEGEYDFLRDFIEREVTKP